MEELRNEIKSIKFYIKFGVVCLFITTLMSVFSFLYYVDLIPKSREYYKYIYDKYSYTSEHGFSEKIQILMKQKNYTEALKLAEDRIKLYPGDANTLYSLGQLYFYTGEYEKSINTFNETVRLKPPWKSKLKNYVLACESELSKKMSIK